MAAVEGIRETLSVPSPEELLHKVLSRTDLAETNEGANECFAKHVAF